MEKHRDQHYVKIKIKLQYKFLRSQKKKIVFIQIRLVVIIKMLICNHQ